MKKNVFSVIFFLILAFSLCDYSLALTEVQALKSYATYLGSSGNDKAYGIVVDKDGYAYITGCSNLTEFSSENLSEQKVSENIDIFIVKLHPNGKDLVYVKYLGGAETDISYGIAVDGEGNAYVTGYTASDDFPVSNALQAAQGGNGDAFVVKLDANGEDIIYATYLGGSETDIAYGIAVDGEGSAYVTGYTASDDFPVSNALQAAQGGNGDAFVAKINPSGNDLDFSTYEGSSEEEFSTAIALDEKTNAYITGFTNPADMSLDSSNGNIFINEFSIEEPSTFPSISSSARGELTYNQITVISPNGGNIWEKGKTYSITWNTGLISGYVAIAVYKNGAYTAAITTLTQNDGSYSWKVPISFPTGSDYKIKIKSLSNGSYDFSDSNFSIQGTPFSIISPNGGETWQKGRTYTITWNTVGIGGHVAMALYRNGAYTATIHGSTPNTGSYSWTIPSGIPSASDYKIKIKALSSGSYDFSDGNFKIQDSPNVTLQSLVGSYRLKGFTLIYDDGRKYSQDSFTDLSGTMKIYSDGSYTQNATLAGMSVSATGKISSIYNNNLAYFNDLKCGNYILGVAYSNNLLSTYWPPGECNATCWEVDVWEKTSSSVSSYSIMKHADKNEIADHCIGGLIQDLIVDK